MPEAGALERLHRLLEGEDGAARVLAYHARTKHAPSRYARALGYLDWATQPDPFRRFEGAPLVTLARDDALQSGPRFAEVVSAVVASMPVDVAHLARFLYDALALSAWKEHGATRWSLRVNPSSGNLHPTEAYVVCGPALGLPTGGGVYHYAPHPHALERRRALAADAWLTLQCGLPQSAFLVGLSSIHWREAWKYGERAYRYCQHDVGHAIGALSYSAAALGWQIRALPTLGDSALTTLLALSGAVDAEREHPDLLLAVWPTDEDWPSSGSAAFALPPPLLGALAAAPAEGTPNRLSADHHDWPVISEVALAAHAPVGFAMEAADVSRVASFPSDASDANGGRPDSPPARHVLRTRRSAVDMDGRTGLTRDGLWSCLLAVTPAARPTPWGVMPHRAFVHNLYFVHRVRDVEPGLYLQVRQAAQCDFVLEAVSERFEPERVTDAPPGVWLYRLGCEDTRMLARATSCGQDIAADGAFAVSMLAELDGAVRAHGPAAYRYLHYEAGLIGHALYLEAEALGLRATGIGCFYDDLVHQLFGWQDHTLAALYHFTVGGAVDDPRLRTAPAYAHLEVGAT